MYCDATDLPRRSAQATVVACALLTLGNLVLYGRVLGFDFVRWDDDLNITANAQLTEPISWALFWESFSADQALRFKPVHFWICRLLYAGFGFDPVAWHALNLGLHIVATWLLFHVLGEVAARAAPMASARRIAGCAFAGAALWSLHPLRAEVVAWATASTYACAAVGLLASFACYLESERPGRNRAGWFAGTWLFAVASYASYPIGLTYAVFLVIFDQWRAGVGGGPPATKETSWRSWRRWVMPAALLAPAVVAVGFTLWSRYANPGIFISAPTLSEVGLSTRVLVPLASVGYLIVKFFWPADLTPNVPPLAVDEAMGSILLLAALTVVMFGAAWWRRRERRDGLFLGGAFVALSLPCLGFIERPMWPVDRYSYLAHMVLAGGASCWLARIEFVPRWARVAGVASGAVLGIAMALATVRQTEIWRDSSSLFVHMEANRRFAEDPLQAAHIYVMWAVHERRVGRAGRSDEVFARAYRLYHDTMRKAVAAGDYARALEVSDYMGYHFERDGNLRRERGRWLLRLGRQREAVVELTAAAAALPGDERTRQLLAEAEEDAEARR